MPGVIAAGLLCDRIRHANIDSPQTTIAIEDLTLAGTECRWYGVGKLNRCFRIHRI